MGEVLCRVAPTPRGVGVPTPPEAGVGIALGLPEIE